jgi:HEAT repeats
MTSARGRRVALWACVGGVVVLGTTTYSFRAFIQEHYWMWRLERGDRLEKQMAVERLGQLNSIRAIPSILMLLATGNSMWTPTGVPMRPQDRGFAFLQAEVKPQQVLAVACYDALTNIVRTSGRSSVPYLITMLKEDFWNARLIAAKLLRNLGPTAEAAITELDASSEDDNGMVRQAAAEALRRIRGE